MISNAIRWLLPPLLVGCAAIVMSGSTDPAVVELPTQEEGSGEGGVIHNATRFREGGVLVHNRKPHPALLLLVDIRRANNHRSAV